jgi:hypothetical protein
VLVSLGPPRSQSISLKPNSRLRLLHLKMPHHGRRASTTSLLSTNTTSSSFSPTKGGTKPPQVQKDYATALAMLQSKYGISEISSMSAPVPLPSKKSPTSKPLSALAEPLGTTNPSSSTTTAHLPTKQGKVGKAQKRHSSAFSLLWAGYHSISQLAHSSPQSSERGDNGDGIKRVDGATALRSSDDGN